jgi:hypothetical protein
MTTRIRSTKLSGMVIAMVMLAAIWAVWGASPAQAIVIINNKTGIFTLTQGEAVRVHVVNTGEERGIIIIGGRIIDSEGNTLAEFSGRRLALGQAETFEFMPGLAEGERLQKVRVELMVEGASRKGVSFIPTLEVFDTATGKTSVGQDFILVGN